jgi:hypothetical protein
MMPSKTILPFASWLNPWYRKSRMKRPDCDTPSPITTSKLVEDFAQPSTTHFASDCRPNRAVGIRPEIRRAHAGRTIYRIFMTYLF